MDQNWHNEVVSGLREQIAVYEAENRRLRDQLSATTGLLLNLESRIKGLCDMFNIKEIECSPAKEQKLTDRDIAKRLKYGPPFRRYLIGD